MNLYALRMRICKGELKGIRSGGSGKDAGVYAPVDEIYGGTIRGLVSAMVNLDTATRPDVDQVSMIPEDDALKTAPGATGMLGERGRAAGRAAGAHAADMMVSLLMLHRS